MLRVALLSTMVLSSSLPLEASPTYILLEEGGVPINLAHFDFELPKEFTNYEKTISFDSTSLPNLLLPEPVQDDCGGEHSGQIDLVHGNWNFQGIPTPILP